MLGCRVVVSLCASLGLARGRSALAALEAWCSGLRCLLWHCLLAWVRCRHQLGDVAWQPSKLELEAQLGASRERQVELEWRLQAMEGLLRQHTALLQGQEVAPLGSLLDAIDDGHVSPPRQVRWCRWLPQKRAENGPWEPAVQLGLAVQIPAHLSWM